MTRRGKAAVTGRLRSAVAIRLFLKAANGHVAFVHPNDVPALMVLGDIEVPMGLEPWLAISHRGESKRPRAVRIQRVGPLQFFTADLATATGRLLAR